MYTSDKNKHWDHGNCKTATGREAGGDRTDGEYAE